MVSRRQQSGGSPREAFDLHGARRSELHRSVSDDYCRPHGGRPPALRAVCRTNIDWGPAMTTVGSLVYQFFEHHLKAERGLSQASIHSYRDGIRLLLLFMAKKAGRPISKLALSDLSADNVRAFLTYLEVERGNNIRSRNHRLAMLHTFLQLRRKPNAGTASRSRARRRHPAEARGAPSDTLSGTRRGRRTVRQPAARRQI